MTYDSKNEPARAPRARTMLGGGAAVVLGALLVAGCGTGGISRGGDISRGKELFTQKCGSCHTLAEAGTSGKIGPNLDDAFGGDRAQHFKRSTIQQVVAGQIKYPGQRTSGPNMPANLVKGSDVDAVAAYIASAAGTGATPAPAPAPAPATTTAAATTGAGKPSPAPSGGGDAAKGKALYASLGCSACHSLDGSKGLGPTFKGLAGSKVELDDGSTVTADDAYLLASIKDPDKQVVKGFAKGVMSSTVKPGQVPDDQARDLVAFIKAQK